MEEFRKGWATLLAAFIGIATGVSSLVFYSQGLFLKPVAMELGLSRGQASLGPLVGALAAALAAPLTGRLMDRVGPARTAVASMLLLAGGLVALGLMTHSLAGFLLLTGAMSLVTVGSSPLSYTRVLVGAFDRHRGLALGLALTGTGVGAFLLPVLLGPFIEARGWRAGYFALAGVVLAASGPLALLLKQEPVAGAKRDLPPLSAVAGRPTFWLLGAIFFLAATGVLGAVVHFPAMLSDAGIPSRQAGAMAGVIGLAVIGGRAAAGLLLDRVPARLVTAGFFGLSAAGVCLLALGGPTYTLAGALALGLSVGAEVDLIAYLVSRTFEPEVYGTAYGSAYGVFLVGGALGPALIGLLYDQTGGYTLPFLVAAGLLATAALLALRIKPAHPADD